MKTAAAALAGMILLSGCSVHGFEWVRHPAAPAAVQPTPTPTPRPDIDSCLKVGGSVVQPITGPATWACSYVVYLGDDGSQYNMTVPFDSSGQLEAGDTEDPTAATLDECDAGVYPDGSAGPLKEKPGNWNNQLELCLP